MNRLHVLTLLLTTGIALLTGGQKLQSGEFNPVMKIGDSAPAWNDLPGVDGMKHSLSDLKDKKVVVVVFTCNSCPYAVDYEDRLINFVAKHASPGSSVGLVAINVNKVQEDSLANMKKRGAEKKFNFPYLFDESQKIARDYGANWTPEFFVLNAERKVVYMGAMDDQTDADKVKVRYIEDAVAAALSDKIPDIKETAARGCAIRYQSRSRKKRP